MKSEKKLISMILAVALLFSDTVIPVYATEPEIIAGEAQTESQEETDGGKAAFREGEPNGQRDISAVGQGDVEEEVIGGLTREGDASDIVPGEKELGSHAAEPEDTSGNDETGPGNVPNGNIAEPEDINGDEAGPEDTIGSNKVRQKKKAYWEDESQDQEDTDEGEQERLQSADVSGELRVVDVVCSNSISCGSPTTFTVNAAGGSGSYEYRLAGLTTTFDGAMVLDISTKKNQSFQKSNEISFTFYTSDEYRMDFQVRDTNTNNYVIKRITFFVRDTNYPSIEQRASSIAAECLKTCSTDFDKAVWLHDWIIDHAEYDYGYDYCSPEGVLARGVGTCESYHRAYELLLNKVGIPTGRITGNGHVWTAVKMDGAWYQVDTTWDDMGASYKGSYYEHAYFGLTDEIMGMVHSDHKTAVPGYESVSLENNYFIKTGEIRQWSDPFVDSIKKNIAEGKTEFTLPVTAPEAYRSVMYSLAAYQLSTQSWDGVRVFASYQAQDNVIEVKTEKDMGGAAVSADYAADENKV